MSNKNSYSRRQFLRTTGSGLLLGGTATGAAELLTGCELHGEISKIPGQARSFITPTDGSLNNDFYVQFGNAGTTEDNHPVLSTEDWDLTILGVVDQELTITWDDLMVAAQSESIHYLKTMRCVFDDQFLPFISNGYWRGVPLRHFLEQVGLGAEVTRLRITGEDGFRNNLRRARVMDDVSAGVGGDIPLLPVILAYELNGQPIPDVHGGPVRLIVPEKFGFKNMRWPRTIEASVADEAFGSYEIDLYQGAPQTDTGNIALTSIFTGPLSGEAVVGPTVEFSGVAMVGAGHIQRVEVSVDGGEWTATDLLGLDQVTNNPSLFFAGVTDENAAARDAELAALRGELVQLNDARFGDVAPAVWVLWGISMDLSPGLHSAQVRAFTIEGAEQPSQDGDGSDGNSAIRGIDFEVL